MNNNLQQIFAHYIDKFDFINNNENEEFYKWNVSAKFRRLMDDALKKDGDEFAEALYLVKASTLNMIDSYTQPFHGLVEYARKGDAAIVKQMFIDLYADDGGDLQVQAEKISHFFDESNKLLEKHFPGSYRYKQNSHSVSAYLFLYDPDHHYMFKATQASIFADCMGFYDDWGTGDNIKLDVFYRMCDQLVDEINSCDALLKTDSLRFRMSEDEMIKDEAKHMLAFDIIYCCSVYDLFGGVSFNRLNLKEKQDYIKNKAKAESMLKEYQDAVELFDKLQEAETYLCDSLLVGTKVKHNKEGLGTVEAIEDNRLIVRFDATNESKKYGLNLAIANGNITADVEGFAEKIQQLSLVLKNSSQIVSGLDRAKRALEPFERFFD